jgi:hypothetical protein
MMLGIGPFLLVWVLIELPLVRRHPFVHLWLIPLVVLGGVLAFAILAVNVGLLREPY